MTSATNNGNTNYNDTIISLPPPAAGNSTTNNNDSKNNTTPPVSSNDNKTNGGPLIPKRQNSKSTNTIDKSNNSNNNNKQPSKRILLVLKILIFCALLHGIVSIISTRLSGNTILFTENEFDILMLQQQQQQQQENNTTTTTTSNNNKNIQRNKDRVGTKYPQVNNNDLGDWYGNLASVTKGIKDGEMPNVTGYKFIFFDSRLGGQGTGNIISGLLSAHLLGEEFQRIVCVETRYVEFLSVFDYIDINRKILCESLEPYLPMRGQRNLIQLINYQSAPDECILKNKLLSDEIVLFLRGNTYPRWPTVPDNYFFTLYKPKQVLLDILPYDDNNNRPEVVVHLREPDHEQADFRKGLDDDSLNALGELLPKGTTYLVTNKVAFYTRFEECCKWLHPNWNRIIHSANGKRWDVNDNDNDKHLSNTELRKLQNKQMWADWYTIARANTVYHTHSDFSISAIHWTNKINSYSIAGYNTTSNQLITHPESWWVDGETPPLKDRTVEAEGKLQLRLCKDVDYK